ncbi:MAG TPA: PepSY domain-containing protein [Vitreimonas sp.]|uniref:PepSY-associated TM helix domain-containing protein n=1 Tax=Vitreimonas sp. TaxID=3069702 RepID=UPI002D7409E3|nr:PepSY domain-containing protein [Vitreimonas sp.]
MRQGALRAWMFVHKWTSLISTLILLMLFVTGLPLIFHDEIDAALGEQQWTPANPGGPLLSYDEILARALENRPGEVPLFMSFDIDRPVVNVTTGPTPDAAEADMHFASFDHTSGALVPPHEPDGGVMHFLLQLHTDMLLGLPGMLFLGAMGVLLVASIVSGVVVYAPFMRRHDFGVLRVSRSPRVKWLDYHNLLGIVTVAWVLVVGLTGVINTLATPILDLWKYDALRDLTAEHNGAARTPQQARSLHAAILRAEAAAPGMTLQFVAFPGGSFSTDRHYAIFLHGETPLTTHLITPVLIDAETGAFDGLRDMPWYAKALSLSKPLHFGDYGGLPLKLLWALLDLASIVILASGVYLWLAKARALAPAEAADEAPAPMAAE